MPCLASRMILSPHIGFEWIDNEISSIGEVEDPFSLV